MSYFDFVQTRLPFFLLSKCFNLRRFQRFHTFCFISAFKFYRSSQNYFIINFFFRVMPVGSDLGLCAVQLWKDSYHFVAPLKGTLVLFIRKLSSSIISYFEFFSMLLFQTCSVISTSFFFWIAMPSLRKKVWTSLVSKNWKKKLWFERWGNLRGSRDFGFISKFVFESSALLFWRNFRKLVNKTKCLCRILGHL